MADGVGGVGHNRLAHRTRAASGAAVEPDLKRTFVAEHLDDLCQLTLRDCDVFLLRVVPRTQWRVAHFEAIHAKEPIKVHRVEETELKAKLLARRKHGLHEIHTSTFVRRMRDRVVVVFRVPPRKAGHMVRDYHNVPGKGERGKAGEGGGEKGGGEGG